MLLLLREPSWTYTDITGEQPQTNMSGSMSQAWLLYRPIVGRESSMIVWMFIQPWVKWSRLKNSHHQRNHDQRTECCWGYYYYFLKQVLAPSSVVSQSTITPTCRLGVIYQRTASTSHGLNKKLLKAEPAAASIILYCNIIQYGHVAWCAALGFPSTTDTLPTRRSEFVTVY